MSDTPPGPATPPPAPLASLLAGYDRDDARQVRDARAAEIDRRRLTLWDNHLAGPVMDAVPGWVGGWLGLADALRSDRPAAAAKEIADLAARLERLQVIWEGWLAEQDNGWVTEAEPWNRESRDSGDGGTFGRSVTLVTSMDGVTFTNRTRRPDWVLQLPWSPDGPRAIPGRVTNCHLFQQSTSLTWGDQREMFRDIEAVYTCLTHPSGGEELLPRIRHRDRVAGLSLVIATTILPDPGIIRRFLETASSDVTIADARQLFHVAPDDVRRRTLPVLDSLLDQRAASVRAAAPRADGEMTDRPPTADAGPIGGGGGSTASPLVTADGPAGGNRSETPEDGDKLTAAPPPADPHAGRPPRPLMGWPEIIQAINRVIGEGGTPLRQNESDHRRIRKLHEECPSPIVFGPKGVRPRVNEPDLLTWWCKLDKHLNPIRGRFRQQESRGGPEWR